MLLLSSCCILVLVLMQVCTSWGWSSHRLGKTNSLGLWAGRSLSEVGLSKKQLFRQVRERINEAASKPGFFDPIEGIPEYKLVGPGNKDSTKIVDCVDTQFVQMVLDKKGVQYQLSVGPERHFLIAGDRILNNDSYPILHHVNTSISGGLAIAEDLEKQFPLKSLTKPGALSYQDVLNKVASFFPAVENCIVQHEPVSVVDRSGTMHLGSGSAGSVAASKNEELVAPVTTHLDIMDSILRETPGQYLCGIDLTLADLYLAPRLFRAVIGLEHFLRIDILNIRSAANAKRPALEAYMSHMFNKQEFNRKNIYVHADEVVRTWKAKIAAYRNSRASHIH